MKKESGFSSVPGVLVTSACFVIVVAGMRAARALLVPFLLSAFVAIICTPFLLWMHRRKIPSIVAILSILVAIVGIGLLLVTFVGSSLSSFSGSLPIYQERLSLKTAALLTWLKGFGMDISGELLRNYFNPGKALKMAASTLSGLSGLFTNLFLILLTVIFILLEALGLPKKIRMAIGDPEKVFGQFSKFMENVNRYLAIKTLLSLLTGLFVSIWLFFLGVDYPFLWGLVAFLLNYVPNIGSIIAAIPAILLALVQLGTGSAVLTALGYLMINVLLGSILEPRFMGRRVGLSTLVVFVSLVFWGWVLGPIGMILSVPLTMIVKIGLESNPDTRWIAVLLGPATMVDIGRVE